MIDIYIQNASIQNDGYESHTSCQKKSVLIEKYRT